MLESDASVSVLESRPPEGVVVPAAAVVPKPRSLLFRGPQFLARMLPALLAWTAIAGLIFFGYQHGWRVPKFSALMSAAAAEPDDWCSEHSVPESGCVECQKKGLPPTKGYGYCREHGVSECPTCHPEVAQLSTTPTITTEAKQRSEQGLAFAPRVENNSKCMLHERRIQLSSTQVLARLGIEVAAAQYGTVQEIITANGEIGFDARAVVRLSPRVPGILWRIAKQVGEQVKQGELLALVDATEVGKAKAEFQQALVQLDLKTQVVASMRQSTAAIPGRDIQEAEATLAEAHVRLLAARQVLLNLGLPLRIEEYRNLAPAEVVRRIQFLGLTDEQARVLAQETASSNLLPIRAPFDGEVIERSGTANEAVDRTKVLFVIADPRRMWLTLHARIEDAKRIQPGQPVHFRHDSHESADTGTVVWISPAVEEKTRTVPVRVAWPNAGSRHHANTFGTAQVVLRQEPRAVVVPSSAVHWEGDCHVVFVRDKEFETSTAKVFHVRKVRPGASDQAVNGPVTEIAAGVLPGELVATTNSGILRSELLKNNLGEG